MTSPENAALSPSHPSPNRPSQDRPPLCRVAAVVNAASGGVGPAAAAEVEQLIRERDLELTLFTPGAGPGAPDVEQAVRSAVESAPDLVLVLAGDGTAKLAAQMCGPSGPLVAPLPGGTLNMLPHALYGPVPWREALAGALDQGVERWVGGGAIGGQAFYVAAILGSPALWAHAREAVRAGKIQEAWRRASYALRRAFSGEVRYALDGGVMREAEALVLICPAVSRAMQAEEALEVAGLELHSAREVFRLAFNGLISDWRRDPGVRVQTCRRGRAWARRSIPCILDGEIQRMPRGVEFVFEPRAFRALAPPLAAGSSL